MLQVIWVLIFCFSLLASVLLLSQVIVLASFIFTSVPNQELYEVAVRYCDCYSCYLISITIVFCKLYFSKKNFTVQVDSYRIRHLIHSIFLLSDSLILLILTQYSSIFLTDFGGFYFIFAKYIQKSSRYQSFNRYCILLAQHFSYQFCTVHIYILYMNYYYLKYPPPKKK